MTKNILTNIFSFLLVMLVFFLPFGGGYTHAEDIPEYFQPNYEINESWQRVLDTFVSIEAKKKIGEMPENDDFAQLYNDFSQVFPRLPQNSEYKIVYEKCLLLTEDLSYQDFSYQEFNNFMNNCYSELNTIIAEINAKYTVEPDVVVQPKSGPAPLTVTFDARGSTDPSNDTIPSDNVYRWYKDTKGVDRQIGKGNVVNYEFKEEGNYYVHMTIRSANHESEGILDGQKTFNVNVSPRTATLSVYANGKKMSSDEHVKVGSQEAQDGIIFDGSSTVPKGGRKILHHYREIHNNDSFHYQTKEKSGKPESITVPLTSNGEYIIKLTTIDNENNTISKNFLLKISDPIAVIEQSPQEGTTQTTFMFDSKKSYSIQSRLKLYTWNIYDEQGEEMYTTQEQKMEYQFTTPGVYTVKLSVIDEMGETDQQSRTIVVSSTPPTPQFTIEPVQQREFPSQFILDASKSTDLDMTNEVDTLSYQRTFSDPNVVQGDEGFKKKQQTIVSFDKKGTYTIGLTAIDSYGKVNTIEKEVEVKSSVRPVIVSSPIATQRGEPIIFAVKSNKEILNYQRNFGDGINRTTQEKSITHTYDKAGVYTVSLTVLTQHGEKNTVTSLVFIGEKEQPIVAYSVEDTHQKIKKQSATCIEQIDGGTGVEHPAYHIQRFEDFSIDMSQSVNIEGKGDGLKFYFQPKDGAIHIKKKFQHRFSDIGCRYVDVFVEDTIAKKTSTQRVWFKVVNALPTLDEIKLSFPQYGNEVGVGFNVQSKANIISDTKYDPLIVKVEALGTQDPDGSISYYTRYYYDKNNPNNILESRISPSSNPYVYFSLPKTIPGEYVFGVRMTDNDGGEIASEEIIGHSSVLPFFPDEKNLDIPMVTLVADRVNIKAGEEVNFTIKSKILSQRKDFDAQKTNKVDFDGDGEFDITTKDDTVSHTYKEPNIDGVVPRAEVMYRGYKGSARGEKITIKNGLKPIILLKTIDKTLLLRDNSIGKISKKRVCFDRNTCKVNDAFIANEGNTFTFEYPDYGTYVVEYTVRDEYGNVATERQVVELTESEHTTEDVVTILSIPNVEEKQGEYHITVGKNLANSVLYYLKYAGKGECFMDTNIEFDSDGNGSPENDVDVLCNQANSITEYNPDFENAIGRIYYDGMQDGVLKTLTKTVVVNFLDYDVSLMPEEQEIYNKTTELIKNIDPTITGNKLIIEELLLLRQNVQSKPDISNSVITLYDLMEQEGVELSQGVENKMIALLESLSNSATVAARGGDAYKQAKQSIIAILPEKLTIDTKLIFQQIEDIEEPATQKEKIKNLLGNLVTLIQNHTVSNVAEQGQNDILQEDYELVVHSNLCKIANYYEVETKTCGSSSVEKAKEAANTITQGTSSGISSILKWVLIVLGILGVGFVIIIVLFALKGKRGDEEEE